jgi:uncharacterized protein (TIGR03435 family)
MHPFASTARILAVTLLALPLTTHAQTTFDVATIRPTTDHVNFESNGTTEASHGTLRMHDVTVATCIHWAYNIQLPLIKGPASLKEPHYDIVAKTDPTTTEAQMRLMLRTLLTERFHLAFHRETTELRVYTLTVAKTGIKMHPADPSAVGSHQNSKIGVVGHAMSMPELTEFFSDALGAPLADATHLPGRYDFTIDFTPYVDIERTNSDIRPDPAAVLGAALKGELGLELVKAKAPIETLVIDHVDPPTEN